jgi:hypothetical protein
MSRVDRSSVLGVLVLTAVVPAGLAALRPFAEPRAALGFAAGWGLALLVMLPGWVLIARAMATAGSHAFVRAFLAAALLRLLFTMAGATAFALALPEPPLLSFLLAFFLGYGSLTLLELRHTLPRTRREPAA